MISIQQKENLLKHMLICDWICKYTLLKCKCNFIIQSIILNYEGVNLFNYLQYAMSLQLYIQSISVYLLCFFRFLQV